MTRVIAGDRIAYRRAAVRRLTGHGANVAVLTRRGGAGAGADQRLARSKRVARAAHGHAFAVGDHDIHQIQLTGVGDRVGPRDRVAHVHNRSGRRIGVFTVGGFLDARARGQNNHAGVDGQVGLTRRQRDRRADARGRVDVAVGRIVAHVGLGERQTGNRYHLNEIVQTWIKIREQIVAVVVSDHGRDDRIGRAVTIIIGPQVDRYARLARFAGVLHTVTILVHKDGVANRGGRDRRTQVVRRIAAANRIANRVAGFVHRLTGCAANVGVLTDRRDALACAGEACARCQRIGRTGYRDPLIVGHNYVVDRYVTGVGDHVGPGHRIVFGDLGASRRVGVLAVGGFFNRKPGAGAKVVARIIACDRIAHWRAPVRRLTRHATDVAVLTSGRRARTGADQRLTRCKRVTRAANRHTLIVGHNDVHQIQFAGVGDRVRPGDRITHSNNRSTRRVGIFTVGGFLDADAGAQDDDTGINGQIRLTRRECDRWADAGRRIDVAIGGVVANVWLRERLPRCGHDLDKVIKSRIKIREQIVAVVVGDRGCNDRIRCAVAVIIGPEIDGDAWLAGLTGVLSAVAIFVHEHRVADRRGGYRRAQIVRRIAVADRIANRVAGLVHRLTGGAADVGVLTHRGDALARTGQAFARRQRVAWAIHSDALIVRHNNVGDAHVTGVGHHVSPGHRIVFSDLGAGRRVGILAVGGFLNRKATAGTEVVTGVRVANLLFLEESASGSNVGVLTRLCRALAGAGDRLARIKKLDRRTRDRHALIIADRDRVQTNIACVGGNVSPGDRLARWDRRARRNVCVAAVGGLLKRNLEEDAKVMTRVAVADHLAIALRAHRTDVRVLAGFRGAVCRTGERLARCERRCRTGHRYALIVDHDDVCQRHAAGVGHDVVPGNRQTDNDFRSGGIIRIHVLGQRFDVDHRAGASVMTRVARADWLTISHARAGRTNVHVRAGLCDTRAATGQRRAWREIQGRTRHDHALIVGHRDRRQHNVALVGHRVLPGNWLADTNRRARRHISVFAVGGLLKRDQGFGTKMMARI